MLNLKTNILNFELNTLIKASPASSRSQIEMRLKDLEKQMKQAAKEFDFEKAAEIRDIILETKASLAK